MHAVQMLISLMASTTTTTSSNSEEGHEAKMQKIWAEAYDAWVNVLPGSSDRVLYFKPVLATATSSSSSLTRPSLPIPEIVKHNVLFGITASDPMGVVQVDPNVNAAANEKLELVLKSMMTSTTITTATTASLSSQTTIIPRYTTYWHGYGLSSGRKEAGYIVAFPKDKDTDNNDCAVTAAQAAMVALAKEFHQGAIYRFDYIQELLGEKEQEGGNMLCRKTIPAAMTNSVEANVVIMRCEKPNDIAASLLDDL